MKNFITKGLCVFFMLVIMFLTVLSAAVEAQSGHGGSTEVIARIEPESTAPTQETLPCTVQPEPYDSRPVQTGEAAAWLAFFILLVSGTILTVIYLTGMKIKK